MVTIVQSIVGDVEFRVDDAVLVRFKRAMAYKLAEKRSEGKHGWWDPSRCDAAKLYTSLKDHVDRSDYLSAGVLAMMLWAINTETKEPVQLERKRVIGEEAEDTPSEVQP